MEFPTSEVIITFLALILNGFVLAMFFKYTHLRTSFAVYIILILSSNLFQITFINTVDIYSVYYGSGHVNAAFCDAILYRSMVIVGCVVYTHVLITINRIWAISYPISYRNYHNKKTAKILCVSAWTWVHIINLPGLGIAVYYRRPIEIYS